MDLHIISPLFLSNQAITAGLAPLLSNQAIDDPAESIAGFGRWCLDTASGRLALSGGAARLLGRDPEVTVESINDCMTRLFADDATALSAAMIAAHTSQRHRDLPVRIERGGLRWLRVAAVPPPPGSPSLRAGLLLDITEAKHSEMREQISFEASRVMAGTVSVEQTVTQLIEQVCLLLGWDWGAFWIAEPGAAGVDHLVCKHAWHAENTPLHAFSQHSQARLVLAGEGLVGQVWSSGNAAWIDDMQCEPNFLRRHSARASGLVAGFAFPICFNGADGTRRHFGVLEFISRQPRQRDAQLPRLSASISELVAQALLRVEHQEYLNHIAQRDDLTGLKNRRHFHALVDAACATSKCTGIGFSILYIDIDHFKSINDAFGHDGGNVVLCEFSLRLAQLAEASGAQVCRLGGDEFAILDSTSVADGACSALAEQVLEAARIPIELNGKQLSVSVSIGVSIYGENGRTTPELLRGADSAMYCIKRDGRNGVMFLNGGAAEHDARQAKLAQRLSLEGELHRAMRDEEFFLMYQPVFDTARGRIVAIEALIRWRKPDGEVIPPDVFIPIAEKSHLIVDIGRWVLRHACADLARLQAMGFGDLQLNVNMAASEFISGDLPSELASIASGNGVDVHRLCLELTEGMLMTHADKVIPVMHALRQLGVKISLDDFGMGYSSLSRLKRLPITSIKIDRLFIAGLPADQDDAAIVRSILDLGRHLGLEVVAEGVEADAQLLFLQQFGCTLIQGFYLGRPLGLDVLATTIQSSRTL
jgi:diguanylate cyclase (GGDEF)-like protein